VVRPGHFDADKLAGDLGDALVIGGDNHFGQAGGLPTLFGYALN
jgi:hypothetical protein